MKERIKIPTVLPEGYKAMAGFARYLEQTSLKPQHKELIKIRASQINGCAYCVDMHSRDARRLGETEQRLYVLSIWRDTSFFTEEEKAVLALTEEVTLIHQRVSDATYEHAIAVLGEQYVAEVIMAAIIINGWNRIGVATEMMPAPETVTQ
ncbi:carboxymuconolactone decarboxylase family protein [Taibaiella koreensis]|uniref:carboxymuconolactone decarboxylase family protein n=1 Tax=Taibaiella koreensis TaxID=1268548 RepID=UPI000E59B270|nr:carboxymuconolactone decarboxylase family protein [Taibaiella koreensis]